MRIFRWFGWCLLVVSMIGFFITLIPVPREEFTIPFTAGHSQGRLVLTYLHWLKTGDQAKIGLSVDFPEDYSDLNEQGRIDLVSRLEIGISDVTPQGDGHVAILPSNPVTLEWLVRPATAGVSSGTLWLFQQTEYDDKVLILARKIDLISKDFLGYSYRKARVGFLIGFISGLILVLSGYLFSFGMQPVKNSQ